MVGGKLTHVHKSASDDFILTSAKWFTADYEEFVQVLRVVYKQYEDFSERSENLRKSNVSEFSLEKITSDFKKILSDIVTDKPKKVDLKIPKLTKKEN